MHVIGLFLKALHFVGVVYLLCFKDVGSEKQIIIVSVLWKYERYNNPTYLQDVVWRGVHYDNGKLEVYAYYTLCFYTCCVGLSD